MTQNIPEAALTMSERRDRDGRPSSGKPRGDSSRSQKDVNTSNSSTQREPRDRRYSSQRGAGRSEAARAQVSRSDAHGASGDSKRVTDRAGRDRPDSAKAALKSGDKTKEKDVANSKHKSDKGSGKLKELPADKVKSAADLEAQWQEEEEKKKKEEEAKRKAEEDRQRKEEEEKKKAEEEEQKKEEEERKSIQDFVKECSERSAVKLERREKNLVAQENRPDESFFSKLDSNLKKNTAFVRKLRTLSELQKDSLVKEFGSLNLSKYVGEAAAAITEAKLKMSDIQCAVQICSIMHQRYAEFAPSLMENFQKYLINKKDEKMSNPSKYRVDLRFFAELVSVGLFTQKEGLPVLANQLNLLISNDKDEHNNLSILMSFCKHCGDDYVGLVPRKIRLLAEKYEIEVPRSQVLPPERQKACRNLLREYYVSLTKHLLKDHKELKSMERQNRKTLQTKGELNTDKKEKYEEAFTAYQKLYTNTANFADVMDEDMPDLPEDEYKADSAGEFDVFNPLKNVEFQYEGDSTLFEDEDSRTFYECLPDLKASIPGILYKESEQSGGKNTVKEEEELGIEEDLETLDIEDVEREMQTEKEIAEEEKKENEESKEIETDEKDEESALEEMGLLPPVVEDDDSETGTIMKIQFEAYALSLPNCVNRDLIDKAAIEFCMNFNTKNNRKKLVRTLFTVHRTRYDLLPFYSRLVATLYPCMPDISSDLVQLLKGDFRWHVRKKDQINIESKLKTVRFIGELVKFKLFPKTEALHCVKMLLFDFSHHNVEMACSLLETCGRFLYRSPDSHHRTKVYLDVMMRKKAALHLESRYSTMIENAFYYSNPPEVQQVTRKVRPPMHEYIRKLLYKDLSKTTTEKTLRQMRKLNWDDPEAGYYATKCLVAVWNVRFNSIHCAANLLAGLAPYHEHVAIQVVDGVLEDIRVGMEVNHPRYNQRRVSCVKYLGELYNYRMVESAVIFKTLYSFITFAVSMDESSPSPLDAPEHLFRIRLTCTLLDTCGQYFDKGASKKKLDCFLVYFQRYYWFKRKQQLWTAERPFPIDIENLMQDTMEGIRPKLKLCQSYEEANKAVEDLENEYKPKIAAVLPTIETDEADTSENEEGLSVIPESDEYSDLSQGLSQVHIGEEGSSQEERTHSQNRTSQDSETGGGSADGNDEDDVDDDDYIESAGEDDLDDQHVNVLTGIKRLKCAEDDDFMTAFDKMMDDNIKARNQESLKVPQLDIAVPMHLKNKSKKFVLEEPEIKEPGDTINFVLMTRKGNKQQFSDLKVPLSAEFATKFKEREQVERVEKERMKQVVLGIHERQEEEDYQELVASMSRPAMVNTNRERRVRYQHPKGAPDADLIFGTKKR